MNEATLAQTVLTGLILSIFLGFFIWGIRTGQFRNIEEAKYRIFKGDKKAGDEAEDKNKPSSKSGGGAGDD